MLIFYLGIFFYWAVFYLFFLSSTPFGGDSSELVSAMTSWGIAHPPGYPFYMLLGNIFTRIFPLGNIYQKTSFLSAVFVLFSSFFLFNLIKKIVKNTIISFLASLFYLSLFPVWLYGIVPEVFALANFLILGQTFFLFQLSQEKNKTNLLFLTFFLGLFFGLSIVHHHLFLLFLPSYFYFLKKKSRLKKIIKNRIYFLFFGLILGSLFYLYAPIASFFKTPLDIENAQTIDGFLRLITRASYGTFKAYAGAGGDFLNRIFDSLAVFVFLFHDFKILGLVFCLVGFLGLAQISPLFFWFFFLNFFILLFFYFYANFFLGNPFGLATYERFLTFLYPTMIVFLSIGILWGKRYLRKKISFFTNKKYLLKLPEIIFYFLFLYLIIINTIKNSLILSKVKDNQKFFLFGKSILQTLPQDSLFIPQSDHSFFLIENLQIVFNLRKDIIIVPTIFDRDYIQKRLKEKNSKINFSSNEEEKWSVFLKKNFLAGFSIFSDMPMSFGIWLPFGLVWQYFPDNEKVNYQDFFSRSFYLWQSYQIPSFSKEEKNILFLDEIRQHYIRQLWSFINFAVINNKPQIAKKIAEEYYSIAQDNDQFLTAYVNLKILLKECDEKLRLTVKRLEGKRFANSYQYLPLLNYYKTCEKNEEKYKKIESQYQKLKLKEERLLKDF